MKNFGFLIAAYSAIWLLLSFYFINIGRKTDALAKKVEILESEKSENVLK
ncbi:MAG: CcmD family protein [Deferribacterales bacterium]|nr:CcmD family protein [Deferribacterales bacterium]